METASLGAAFFGNRQHTLDQIFLKPIAQEEIFRCGVAETAPHGEHGAQNFCGDAIGTSVSRASVGLRNECHDRQRTF